MTVYPCRSCARLDVNRLPSFTSFTFVSTEFGPFSTYSATLRFFYYLEASSDATVMNEWQRSCRSCNPVGDTMESMP